MAFQNGVLRLKLWSAGLVVAGGLLFVVAGCSTDSREASDDPTTRALSDPMHYKGRPDDDISGGGLTNFDSHAFKKDMDDVLNP